MEAIKKYFSKANRDCSGLERFENYLSHFKNATIPEDAPSVGIIGSGPAGLAAAHDLCLMGVKPIIYEMEPVPAGMLYLGVPEYRLPRDLIKAAVEVIKMLGTEIRCHVRIGKDVARTLIRQTEYDVSCTALRQKGVKEVHMLCLESFSLLARPRI